MNADAVLSRALVLFSGGQDSTTCLAWALENFGRVETIGFDYGQRHAIELSCRRKVLSRISETFPNWGAKLGEDTLITVPSLKALGETAMTDSVEIAMQENGLPNTFVPGRNILFFTLAAGLAYRRGIETLVGGMCETDYSGYPDCREITLQAMGQALSLGLDKNVTIATPLMYLDKAKTWDMAYQLGGDAFISLLIDNTHTCYLGDRSTKHDWGFGCGSCPACVLRAKGYANWQAGLRNSA